MALVYVGSLSLMALCPLVADALGEVSIALNAAFEGNLAVNASFSASPPTVGVILTELAEFTSQLTTAFGLGLPMVSFNASMAAALVGKLNAAFGFLATLEVLLAASVGILAFSYVGTANAMGAAVTTELATQWPDGTPSSGTANAMLFGAVSSISRQQLPLFLDGLSYAAGLVYAGKIALAALSAVTLAATAQGDAAIDAQLAGALALQASLDVSVPEPQATLEAMAEYQATLLADGALALPDVQFALDATASAAAGLSANYGAVLSLGAALARYDATVFVYTYTGAGNALGAAITTALASTWGDGTTPTNTTCSAALLGAVDAGTWTALGAFFGGA